MISSPLILCLETSNEICSVAISRGKEIISIRESSEKNSHAQNINIFIQDVLREAKISSKEINAVAVSAGPGSYTGLRIGVSSAKGFCIANDIPLIAINTLAAMLSSIDKNNSRAALIHARQNEFYCSAINHSQETFYENELIFSGSTIFSKDEKIFVATNDIKIASEKFFGSGFIFIDDFFLSAKHLGLIAIKKFKENAFENLAYFEPNYIKPVHITKNSI